MGGAVYQLNLKGPQDLHLTGNPEHNFIKQVYKRHVNFAIEQKNIIFKNEVDFGRKVELTVPRKGDFLYKMHLCLTLPPLVKKSGTYAGWTNSIGHALIDYVEISIGNTVIDRHYGLFLEIWNELTRNPVFNSAENSLIGKYNQLESLEYNALSETFYQIPLHFWFCNNIGSALPLIALQFHEVKLALKFRPFEECIVFDGNTPPDDVSIKNPYILAEYIFMDDIERIKYAKKEHSYLITQVQSIINESINVSLQGGIHKSTLPFNNPCSELFFVIREKDNEDNNDWFNFAKRTNTILTNLQPFLKSAKITLDGHERTEKMSEFTLRVTNNNRYHTNTTNKNIYTMSFCNDPEKQYPTGSLNFSLIDQAQLIIDIQSNIQSPVSLFVFSRNFNFINIKQGMFQIKYL